MEPQESYPIDFKRGFNFFLPKGIIIFIIVITFFDIMGSFSAGKWQWGLARVLLLFFFLWTYRWLHRTPIVQFNRHELQIYHYQFMIPKKVPYKEIKGVDEPRPSRIRILLKTNKEIIIQKHWFEWKDRQPFLAILQNHVEI